VDKAISHTKLNAGETVTGTLSFDAPTGPLRLAYVPGT
jgi:hypothetical protein